MTLNQVTAVHGILLVDKPQGLTSNRLLQKVKRLLGVRKAGHTGSLDPLATGMLPICVGEATKFSQYLLNADKEYEVIAQLGVRTDSLDAEGEVTARCEVPNLNAQQIEQQLQSFRGEIKQIPPMYSALKHQGQPLYKLARKGVEIERKARAVHIKTLSLLEYRNNQIKLFVHCSKGTYIRSLVDDLGQALQCGAHVISLRRLSVAGFKAEQMVCWENLQQAVENNSWQNYLLPTEIALEGYTEIKLTLEQARCIQQGKRILLPALQTQAVVTLYLNDGRFLGVGEVLADNQLAARRLLSERL